MANFIYCGKKAKYKYIFLIFLFGILFYGNANANNPEDHNSNFKNINPDPNGEPWIVGGERKLTPEEQEWLDNLPSPYENMFQKNLPPNASPEDIEAAIDSVAASLPSAVDNSKSIYFRPIFNQKGSSCSQASGIGYVFTYEMARARKIDLTSSAVGFKKEDYFYPPGFTYNYLNRGSDDNGSHFTEGWMIAEDIGIPNVTNYDGKMYLSKPTKRMSGYKKYYNAATNKINTAGRGSNRPHRLETEKDSDFIGAKQWLADGHIGSFSGVIDGSEYIEEKTIRPSNSKKEFVLKNWGIGIGHTMTVVGYDDDVCYDYVTWNTNGSQIIPLHIDDCGAFKIANSHGTRYQNSGFVWVPYQIFRSKAFFTPVVQEVNDPTYMLNFEIAHPSRSTLTPGVAAGENSVYPTYTPHPWTFHKGGSYPMNGDDDTPIKMAMDVSEIANDTEVIKFFALDESPHLRTIISEIFLTDYSGATPVDHLSSLCTSECVPNITNGGCNDTLVCTVSKEGVHTVSLSYTSGGVIESGSYPNIRNEINDVNERSVIDGDFTKFKVTPDSGYELTSISGCGGSLSGLDYSTDYINSDCTISAIFSKISYNVATHADTGGSISPSGKTVTYGSTTTFTITPNTGYLVGSVTGCGGSLSGNTYTTGAITSNCTVNASFIKNYFTINANAGTGGNISPSSRDVTKGLTTTFTVTPNTGYSINSVTGCGGSLSGNTYTTGAITSNCTVNASFYENYHTVKTNAGTGGNISPSSRTVPHGATASFTISINDGYQIYSISGCSGSLSGNVYTTRAITSNCTVNASFQKQYHTIHTNSGTGGSISPVSRAISHGNTTSFTVTPDSGYSIDSVNGCGGSLSGNTYTTGEVTSNCTINATFKTNTFECKEYNYSNDQHVSANRAIKETTSGWWWTSSTTYKAIGSNENLGSSGSTVVKLKEDPQGYYSKGECPKDPAPPTIDTLSAPAVRKISDNGNTITFEVSVSGTASDPNNDIEGVTINRNQNSSQCTGTTNFNCSIEIEINKSELPKTISNIEVFAEDMEGQYSNTTLLSSVTLNDSSCQEFTTDLNEHGENGRAWSEYETTWFFGKWYIYAVGSDEFISNDGRDIVTLYELDNSGIWHVGSCPN